MASDPQWQPRRRLAALCGVACALLILALAGCGSQRSVTVTRTVTLPSTSTGGGSTGASTSQTGTAPTVATVADASQPLRVSGDHLVIGSSGTIVQLRGVNRSGTEYKCEQDGGYFDGPDPDAPDSLSMIAAMKSWDINVVRVPLNEGCWLGHGAPSQYSGANYQQEIEEYVQELNSQGLFVILSLQWLDINNSADYEPPMADATYGPSFWQSVATAFRPDPDVLFDLYNEPFDIGWSCWLDGCHIPAGSGSGGGGSASWPAYEATGMQQLVNAVRSTGATQPLLVGGLDYSLDLAGWLAHEPSDPDHALVASVHSYGGRSPCAGRCQSAIVHVARTVPVVFGELGEVDCASSYIDPTMAFADRHGIGYLGWAWDAVDTGWSCTAGPALINSYDGAPTAYGAGFRHHFQALGEPIGTSGDAESGA